MKRVPFQGLRWFCDHTSLCLSGKFIQQQSSPPKDPGNSNLNTTLVTRVTTLTCCCYAVFVKHSQNEQESLSTYLPPPARQLPHRKQEECMRSMLLPNGGWFIKRYPPLLRLPCTGDRMQRIPEGLEETAQCSQRYA